MKKITVASHKGGVGKTSMAIHLAAYLASCQDERVLVFDQDKNRSALGWFKRSPSDPGFTVIDSYGAAEYFQENQPTVMIVDCPARPDISDLEAIAAKSDLIVVPTTPDALSMDTLPMFLEDLRRVGSTTPYRFLLNRIPAAPRTDGADARLFLDKSGQPIFAAGIREYAAFSKAAAQGTICKEARRDSGRKDPMGGIAWNDIVALGKEVVEVLGA